MLLTLAMWALMATVIYAVGIGLVPPETFSRVGDRIMAALWVGFVVVSNTWLALALFMPLAFWRTLGLTALGVAALWLYRRRRNPGWAWLPTVNVTAVPLWLWLIGAGGLVELALLRSQVVAYGDTPNYHYQAVLWLETYGVTPGIVLLDCRLGFASSWYAFVAPFDTCAWWHKRVGGAGGLPTTLLWLQVCLVFVRVRQGVAQVSDWFMLLASGLIFVLFTYTYVALDSLSTDTPTLTLVVAVIWALLRSTETLHGNGFEQATVKQHTCETIWLPMALACGAFACKLSAIPVTVGVTLWALWRTRHQPKQWLSLLGVGAMLSTPVTIARFITSGYPLFPSALGAYPVEWAYNPALLEPLRIYIREFVRWSWHLPFHDLETSHYSNGWSDFSWLPRWLQIETVLALYLTFSFFVGIVLLRRRVSHSEVLPWVIGIAWVGIAYVFITAPTLRYGISFFILLPALWIAYLITDRRMTVALLGLAGLLLITVVGMVTRTVFLGFSLHRIGLILVISFCIVCAGLVILLGGSAPQTTGLNQRRIGFTVSLVGCVLFSIALFLSVFRPSQLHEAFGILVRPRVLRTPDVVVRRVNNVEAYQPVQGPCWAAPLPCGLEIDPRIALRDPKRGLVGGFKRQIRPFTE